MDNILLAQKLVKIIINKVENQDVPLKWISKKAFDSVSWEFVF